MIRGCGYRGVSALSYCRPDNAYWRGLDGSVVFNGGGGAPGRGYFFDHCYQEPCRTCRGLDSEGCAACQDTGLDLAQNYYPSFEPVDPAQVPGDVGQYTICSEEMFPPEGFSATLRAWEARQPGVRYVWGTLRNFAALWAHDEARVDAPPAD